MILYWSGYRTESTVSRAMVINPSTVRDDTMLVMTYGLKLGFVLSPESVASAVMHFMSIE